MAENNTAAALGVIRATEMFRRAESAVSVADEACSALNAEVHKYEEQHEDEIARGATEDAAESVVLLELLREEMAELHALRTARIRSRVAVRLDYRAALRRWTDEPR
jgi:hypothetical protein